MHAEKARNHNENRAKVCVVCVGKAKYPLTPIFIERIQKVSLHITSFMINLYEIFKF